MTLSPKDARALKLGALIQVPALLYAGVVKPYVGSVRDLSARVSAERALLARERGLIGAAKDGSLAAARADADAFTQRHLLVAHDETLLYARATEYVQSLAQFSRAEIEDAAVVSNDVNDEGLRVLVLALRGKGNLEGVARLIHLLEYGPAVVSIAQLQLVPAESEAALPMSFGMELTIYGGAGPQ